MRSVRSLFCSAVLLAKPRSLQRITTGAPNVLTLPQTTTAAPRPGHAGVYLIPNQPHLQPLSFWHDVAWRPAAGTTFTFVSEIPKNTTAKLEVCKELPFNPIVQDRTKDDKPRFYPYVIPWNYGCIPQTLEDPEEKDALTGQLGDGDPIDVVEIGASAAQTGSIRQVKVLGALALLDQGETDWKVIAIDTADERAGGIHSVADIPDTVAAITAWFRDYKIPDGKPPNKFGLDGKPTTPVWFARV